ncbi:hypothetical protein AB4Z54_25535, partial [Streptomyces sp. MCAF7]
MSGRPEWPPYSRMSGAGTACRQRVIGCPDRLPTAADRPPESLVDAGRSAVRTARRPRTTDRPG